MEGAREVESPWVWWIWKPWGGARGFLDRWMVFLRLEVELSERERETAQLKGWSRGQIDDARELSGTAWWCLAIGCGFPRHALTEDGRRAAKASLDTQHAKTGELADCPGRKPECPGRARIFGVVTTPPPRKISSRDLGKQEGKDKTRTRLRP